MIFGKSAAVPILQHLSLTRLRDFMMPTLQPTIAHLDLLAQLFAQIDVPLSKHLIHTKPFYALSSILTLFAHDTQSYSDISLLFDFFIASHPALPVYLYAAITIHRREEVFQFEPSEQELIHATLSKMPQPFPLGLSDAIATATALFSQYPPSSLQAWSNISQYSVLHTWRLPEAIKSRTVRPKHSRDQDYDYIELDEVREKPKYAEYDVLLDAQIADAEVRAQREVEKQKERQRLRQRKSATKRLGAAISLPKRDNSRQEPALQLDNTIKTESPSAAQVNGTVQRRRFVFHTNSNTIVAFSMSVCVGLMGVWLAYFVRHTVYNP
ncbi:hypothetical protein V1512DRAFT_212114 [Lipomyces arxii]|uniref:uncharacterized protein n=1 Tax=Lipomyces arxii TaxID=56418 RepID=UPI0034CE84E2